MVVEGPGPEQVAGQVGAVLRVRDPFDRAREVGHPFPQELSDDVLEAVVQEHLGAGGGSQVHPGLPLGSCPTVLVQEAEDLEGVAALARDGDPLAAQEGEVEAAAELARKLARANPGRSFWLVGDSAYINAAMLSHRPENLEMIGPCIGRRHCSRFPNHRARGSEVGGGRRGTGCRLPR